MLIFSTGTGLWFRTAVERGYIVIIIRHYREEKYSIRDRQTEISYTLSVYIKCNIDI